ncbi:WAT1-related protein At3g30340 [Ricinus communis]|uniref:WAT1-related protein n=1 Tax=Ricinus communis TaxID=3988 RepID=B9RMY4_RICCO|nr:WAT1-related protein At3g30340 [Ricinus communis]EEF47107.1 Auxin-induced protein 5NG4, putative [Ricinus communis]|eukprot:XP_002515123.1 WAT1-related protein At3g30340 [Ricinus communis]
MSPIFQVLRLYIEAWKSMDIVFLKAKKKIVRNRAVQQFNMSCREQSKTVLAMLFVNFSFAAVNILLKKVIDGGTNHMAIVTYRLSIAAIFLAPIACYCERKTRPRIPFKILCYLFLGALVGVTLTQYLFLLGLEYTSTTFSCAFLNMVPVNTFILALPFGLEKVNVKSKAGRAKLLGATICMTGAILLTVYKGIPLTHPHSGDLKNHVAAMMTEKKRHRSWVLGSIFLMAGCVAWSSWFLIQAKIGKTYPCKYSSTAILSSFAAIQAAVVTLIFNRNVTVWVLKGKLEIITIVYAGVVGSGLCYVGMSWCVKERGPVFTAAFTPFTQIFAAMFDFSVLHDQIYLGSVIGSILVIAGLYTLLWGKSIEAEECAMKQKSVVVKRDGNSDVESQVPAENINRTSS